MISLGNEASQRVSLIDLSDQELVVRIIAGDANAYDGIMRRYNQRLFRVTRGILDNDAQAMDAIQETYLKAFSQLTTLKDINALPAWLTSIARREALQYLRRNKRNVSMDPAQMEPVIALAVMMKTDDQPESKMANDQLKSLLESCIDKLPSTFREVFILRSIEQCSVNETANILEISEATVKTRLFRAKALLQQQLSLHIQESNIALYEFAGHRCDAIVQGVLTRLAQS